MIGWEKIAEGRWRYEDSAGRQLLLVQNGVYVTITGVTITALMGPAAVVSDQWPMGLPGEDSPLTWHGTYLVEGADQWSDDQAWAYLQDTAEDVVL